MVATARRGMGTGKGLAKKPPKMKRDGVHAHGCVGCKVRFEDACGDPQSMELCADCRVGRPVLSRLLIESRLPVACCRELSRPLRGEERHTFRIYQDIPWFVCPKCCRTFPFRNPTKENSRA